MHPVAIQQRALQENLDSDMFNALSFRRVNQSDSPLVTTWCPADLQKVQAVLEPFHAYLLKAEQCT